MRYVTILLTLLLTASAADSPLAGRYAGDWKSNGGGGNGTFHLSLAPGSEGAWKCEVSFALAGADVKTTMREVKVDQSKLEAAYDFDLMGNVLRSHIKGELKGNGIEGSYQTTTVDGGSVVDDGIWNAAREK
jgi:hypothetical protein